MVLETLTSVILLPFESRLEVRECPDLFSWLCSEVSVPNMLDLLICPLLVLFGAAMGSGKFAAFFRLSANDFDLRAGSVLALRLFEVEIEES
jgi:hypothetical protein